MSVSTSSSLLHDVLRPHHINTQDGISARLAAISLRDKENGSYNEVTSPKSPPQGLAALDDSDDELVGVVCLFRYVVSHKLSLTLVC